MSMQHQEEKKRRGGAWLRLGIAAAAIIGIGGALTTAMWVDNVDFTGTITGAEFELQGGLSDGVWESEPIEFVLTDVSPAANVTFTVWINNPTGIAMTLANDVSATFDEWPELADAISVSTDSLLLGANEHMSVDITIDTSAMPVEAAGQSGTVTVSMIGMAFS